MQPALSYSRVAPSRGAALAFSTFVVDVQPDVGPGELAAAASQCASCNFVDFLRGVDDLPRYLALAPLSRLLYALPQLADAYASADAEALGRVTGELGARRCYQVLAAGAPRRLPGPAIHQLDGGMPDSAVLGDDWLMVPPGAEGPAGAGRTIEALCAAGHERIILGSHQHSATVEHWAAFCDRPDMQAEWDALLARVGQLPAQVGLALAYTPCALLQVRANIGLERRRAQLDTHFRRLSGESSMMCPENVSGYGLVNDVRDLDAANLAPSRFALRYEQLVLAF